MTEVLLLILGFAVGFILGKRTGKTRSIKEDKQTLIEKQAQEKQDSLDKVLKLFDEKQKVTNDDVENLLDVSNATAERYLDALEQQGRIKQVGRTGRHVYYQKK